MIVFTSCILAFYIVTLFVFIQMIVTSTVGELFNPYEMADANCVDMITATILVVINHIAFLPEAICYWIYKLCTIGRK
jgi:hypothetical protein